MIKPYQHWAKTDKILHQRNSLWIPILSEINIGEILEVTESRICQLHGQALLRIKARMSEWNEQDQA